MDQVGSDKRRFEDMRQALELKGYEIIKSIGKGAFGEVVLAKQSSHYLRQNQHKYRTRSRSSASST